MEILVATSKLASWYPSERAKRNLGTLCSAVFQQEKPIYLLGTADEPLLVLERLAIEPGDEEISIDEARADWSNVTLAAAIYGTRFRIQRRRSTPSRVGLVLAILHRCPEARHPAEKYLRSSSADANRLAERIEALAKEVRKLGANLARLATDDLIEATDRLDRAADIIDRRFRQLWRIADGLPGRQMPILQ
jgi:hypothetical protein